ncbi:MAG: hypothetical protein GY788_11195 [bacterium]|nr:hypothetical protein [bacterium]
MKQGSCRLSRDILSDVQSQFELWRRSRSRGTRIPEALWRTAVEAAREHGVSRVAQALGLDYYGLKKRLKPTAEVSESARPAESGFVEIPLFASAPECVLELQDVQGARLRVELRGSMAARCETLAQALWSVGR